MLIVLFLLLFASFTPLIYSSNSTTTIPRRLTNEKRLIRDLLDHYQVKWGRPVNNMSEKVVVYFGINLVQLLDLDEKNQVLITNVYSVYQWNDKGLKWHPAHYGGLNKVRLPVNRIWTPDIVLYNYADTRLEEKREALAVVFDDGTVEWRPPSIFKSTCQIDIVKFPYDVQKCHMKFGSWTYGGDSIDIQFFNNRTEISLDEYTESNEWDIIEAPAIRNEKFYSCCKEPFPDLTFYLLIKRRAGFYNYILVLPCVLLSCLTMVLFWLPPESPAKMVLGMNIFSSFFVLLLLLSKNVPSATSNIPLLGGYYCINMVMVATSTCACTVVVHIYFRGNGRVPLVLRKIFLQFLAKMLCMQPKLSLPQQHKKLEKDEINIQQQQQPVSSVVNKNLTNGDLIHLVHHNNNNRNYLVNNDSAKLMTTSTATKNGPTNEFLAHHASLPNHFNQQQKSIQKELSLSFNLIENDIKEIRDYLRHTRKKIETTEAKTKQTNEWKQVALVLDRTLFYLYWIAIVVSVTLMFPR